MPKSRQDVKRLRSLHERRGRAEAAQFLAEGPRVLEEALRHGHRPLELWACASRLDGRGSRIVSDFERGGGRTDWVEPHDLDRIADARTPQGLLGVFALPSLAPPTTWPGRSFVVLLDRVSDPGNVGTLIRSAAAFGCDAAWLLDECADPFAPKVVRSTAGAIFTVPIVRSSTSEAVRQLSAAAFALVTADRGGAEDRGAVARLARADRLCVAVGAEALGVSEEISVAATFRWRLPSTDRVESLNAAVAGSITLYEFGRERGIGRTPPFPAPQEPV